MEREHRLGERDALIRVREDLGMTRRDLAAELGVDYTVIYKVEVGIQDTKVKLMRRWADALGGVSFDLFRPPNRNAPMLDAEQRESAASVSVRPDPQQRKLEMERARLDQQRLVKRQRAEKKFAEARARLNGFEERRRRVEARFRAFEERRKRVEAHHRRIEEEVEAARLNLEANDGPSRQKAAE